jgi:hypothetical protein
MMADYEPTPELTLEELTREIKALVWRSWQDYYTLGHRLKLVKGMLTHGAWLAWLEEEMPCSVTTAERCMRADDLVQEYPALREGTIAVETSAIDLLTSRKTPTAVVRRLVRDAAHGKHLTQNRVQTELAKVRAPKISSKENLSLEPASVLDLDDTGVDPDLDTAPRPLTSIRPPLALPEGMSFSDDDDSPSVDELMRQAPPAEDPLRTFTRPQSRWVLFCEGLRGFLDYEEELEEALAGRTVARLEPIWPAARRQLLAALLAEFRDLLEDAP